MDSHMFFFFKFVIKKEYIIPSVQFGALYPGSQPFTQVPVTW